MTPAEKQRRYRERKFGNKPLVTKASTAKGAQAARITELEAELARERHEHKEALAKFGNMDAVTKYPPTMSKTDRQELAAYKRQIKSEIRRELEAQFEQRVNDEARQWFDHNIEVWCNRFAIAEGLIQKWNDMFSRNKPITSRRVFRQIRASMHPDKGVPHEVAVEFNAKADVIEAVLCGSKDEQEKWARTARRPNLAELMAAREKVRAERRAKRAAAKANKEFKQ
jgi:hypothetical protein